MPMRTQRKPKIYTDAPACTAGSDRDHGSGSRNPFRVNSINVTIALGIATIKASLVALIFMHLRNDKPVNGYRRKRIPVPRAAADLLQTDIDNRDDLKPSTLKVAPAVPELPPPELQRRPQPNTALNTSRLTEKIASGRRSVHHRRPSYLSSELSGYGPRRYLATRQGPRPRMLFGFWIVNGMVRRNSPPNRLELVSWNQLFEASVSGT